MRAIVIHAPRDLRMEEFACGDPGPGEARVRLGAGGAAAPICITVCTVASGRSV